MSQKTDQRILEAAAELFAARGFEHTSVRDITSRAGVNLAAVNYHFGSRDALIQAVAERYLTPLSQELERQLDDLLGEEPAVSLEELLEILVKGMLKAVEPDAYGVHLFMRLLGSTYLRSQEHLRHFLLQRYGTTFERVLTLLRRETPHLRDDEFFWRCHFVLGACFLPLSSYDSLNELERDSHGAKTPLTVTLHRLIPFLAAGLRAEQDKVSHRPEQLW